MPSLPAEATAITADWLDASFVVELRRQMVRFAQLHLQDATLAEDAVQEALLGALTGTQRFAGRSAIKTWVFAILKHKIADLLRHKKRTVNAGSLLKDDDSETMDEWFDQHGHWLPSAAPCKWDDPDASLEQRQFWAIFETCLDGVPPQQARVFMLREFMDFETDEISAQVGISASNVFVSLHRARLRLRECLDQRWFANT
jgi:RNA polymerase sigma-70 factor (ECF subfamily)